MSQPSRSAVDEYLNGPSNWQNVWGVSPEEARRQHDEVMREYRNRIGVNPTSTFRSSPAPQQEQGRAPQPYAGVGVGSREEYSPAGTGPPRGPSGAPSSAVPPPPRPFRSPPPPPQAAPPSQPNGSDEWDQANYPAAGTGPPRGPGGTPQASPPPPRAAAPPPPQAPFQNADEYTGDMPGVSAPLEHSSVYVPQPVPNGLPAPYNSKQSIIAMFGQQPNKSQIRKALIQFHPDRGGNVGLYQNVMNAINNAYGQIIVGSGKRRKYRY